MVEYSDPRDFGFRPETVMTALMPYEQYSSKTRRLILGIDMCIASVGVCLIDIRNHEIILMASHIFKAPVEGKQKDISARQSGTSIRRGYRSVRRTTKRRKNRKKAVRDIEKKYVLIPDDADGQWFAIRKGEPDVLHLRGKALLYKLNGRELARILYAFAGRRGYIDHGKGTTDDDSGKVKKALSENRKILDENGYETIAQYLLKQPTSRNREGDYRYMVDIEMVTDEVHTIFRHQRDLGSDIATEELEGEYLSALRWLTDTSARDKKIYSRVGYCTYLGAPEKRAASSLISFEMVRAYEKLSNIKIEHQGREATYISPEKRNEIVESLFAVSKNPKPLKWSQLREKLGMQSSDSFDSRLPTDEKGDCIKIPAWNALCRGLFTSNRALLDRLHDDTDIADAVCSALTYASSGESLRNALENLSLDLSEQEIDSLLNLPYASKLFSGYCSTGVRALQMLRDAFKDPQIEKLYDAEKATGLYEARQALAAERNESKDGLLCPYLEFDPTCTNPVVLRATAQVRRMINSIIRHYGLPDIIRVEVAKDLKRSKHEKAIIAATNKANKDSNEQAKKDLVAFYGLPNDAHVSSADFEKMRLYREQFGQDPYTGKGINLERMLNDRDYVEIDHILPFSRSCDDSKSNKVLCLTKSNRDKANRTPYEWMTSGEPSAPDFGDFCRRMDAWAGKGKSAHYTKSKLSKLKNSTFGKEEQKFIDHNLNDTRYMSRQLAMWVRECLPFPDDKRQHVFCVAGAATSLMRRIWGIGIVDEKGKKDRSDDRHHAVDAAVIACCSPEIVKGIARVNSGRSNIKERERLRYESMPYPEFKAQVEAWIPCIVPTRTVSRTATGSLLKDTVYPYVGVDDRGKDLYRRNGKIEPASTLWKDGSGGCKLYDGAYGLMAVFDESMKKSGSWRFDPIYYIDVPNVRQDFIREFTKGLSIDYWPKVQLKGDERRIFLKQGDVLLQDGCAMRYYMYNVSNGVVNSYSKIGEKSVPLQKTGPLSDESFPKQAKWDSSLTVMQEDCLGLCWLKFLSDRVGQFENSPV